MELRRLDKSEHGRTRCLWESVFDEDSKAFLDYYYFFKTRDNEIYVIEEDGDIRSMLQLNPYKVQVEDRRFAGHYIIAVATEEAYRKRGYMGKLLRESMREMYHRKELFTFLMPAAEEIYIPYDFRFVYDQNAWVYTVGDMETAPECPGADAPGAKRMDQRTGEAEKGKENVSASEAGMGDGAALTDFFNTYFADRFQVYAVRDESYYQTMIFEQQSENGGIRLLKREGEIVGAFLYGDEDGLEIREPLYLKGYETDFWNTVHGLLEERGKHQVTVYAGIDKTAGQTQNERKAYVYIDKIEDSEQKRTGHAGQARGTIVEKPKKPMIMARIIHLESLLKVLKVKDGEEMNCSFAVLDSILPQNSRIWRLKSKSFVPLMNEEEPESVRVDAGNESGSVPEDAEDVTAEEQEGQKEQKEIPAPGDLSVSETEDSEGVLTIAALTSLLFGYQSVEEVAEEQDVYLTEHLMEELEKIQTLKSVYLNEIV